MGELVLIQARFVRFVVVLLLLLLLFCSSSFLSLVSHSFFFSYRPYFSSSLSSFGHILCVL